MSLSYSAVLLAGAADCASCVATLLELARLVVQNPSIQLSGPLIFLLNGGEETAMQASHGFISQVGGCNAMHLPRGMECSQCCLLHGSLAAAGNSCSRLSACLIAECRAPQLCANTGNAASALLAPLSMLLRAERCYQLPPVAVRYPEELLGRVMRACRNRSTHRSNRSPAACWAELSRCVSADHFS